MNFFLWPTQQKSYLIMRLIVSPISELRNRVFTSSDVVTGLVYLDIHNSLSISEIEFSIGGKRTEGHQQRKKEKEF